MREKVRWYIRTVCLTTDCDWMTLWEGADKDLPVTLEKGTFTYGQCHSWLTLMSLMAYSYGLLIHTHKEYSCLFHGLFLWTIPMDYSRGLFLGQWDIFFYRIFPFVQDFHLQDNEGLWTFSCLIGLFCFSWCITLLELFLFFFLTFGIILMFN